MIQILLYRKNVIFSAKSVAPVQIIVIPAFKALLENFLIAVNVWLDTMTMKDCHKIAKNALNIANHGNIILKNHFLLYFFFH